jgi:hypothetical protein
VSSGACNATASATVIVYPDVPTPNITQSVDTLYCSFNAVYYSYQWYSNNVIIPNATNSFYVAPASGNYNVAVSDIHGCSISVGINIVLNVGLQTFSELTGFSLSTNPATNELFLDGNGSAENSAITVYNMIGQIMQEERIKQINHTPVDIANLSSGVYFVEVQQSRGKWVGRFVKE